jgi:hypothetical protein
MAGQGSDDHLVRNDQHGVTQDMVLAYLVQRPVRARAAAPEGLTTRHSSTGRIVSPCPEKLWISRQGLRPLESLQHPLAQLSKVLDHCRARRYFSGCFICSPQRRRIDRIKLACINRSDCLRLPDTRLVEGNIRRTKKASLVVPAGLSVSQQGQRQMATGSNGPPRWSMHCQYCLFSGHTRPTSHQDERERRFWSYCRSDK